MKIRNVLINKKTLKLLKSIKAFPFIMDDIAKDV